MTIVIGIAAGVLIGWFIGDVWEQLRLSPPKLTDRVLATGMLAMGAMAVGLIAGAFYYGIDHATIIGLMGVFCIVFWFAQRFVFWARPDLEHSPEVYAVVAERAGGTPLMVKNALAISGVMLIIMALSFDEIVRTLGVQP
jgi:hypothetical protein